MLKEKEGKAVKSVYHSDLRKLGEVKVHITSGVLTSKYKHEGEAGHYYVSMNHDGQEHLYMAEGRDDAAILGEHRGNEVTILAEGYGNDKTATLKVTDAGGVPVASVAAPVVAGKVTTKEAYSVGANATGANAISADPIKRAQEVASQAALAYAIAIGAAKGLEKELVMTQGEEMAKEVFVDSVRSIIIHMSNRGVISSLPVHDPVAEEPKKVEEPWGDEEDGNSQAS